MFERGIYDAEHDELNSFYYQHYYYYRQGYDQARRKLRGTVRPPMLLWLAVAVVVAAVGFGGWWLLTGGFAAPVIAEVPLPTQSPVVQSARPTLRPTPRMVPTVVPTSLPVLTLDGQAVVVNLNGVPLRTRRNPGISPIVGQIAEGSIVTLREGPVAADGYLWWRVETPRTTGWVAERSPEGVPFLEPVP